MADVQRADRLAMPSVAELAAALCPVRFMYRDEIALHEAIVARLAAVGVHVADVQREVHLGAAGRIDFLFGGLGVEVKVDGRPPAVLRQLGRYAAHPRIDQLVLITTRRAHLSIMIEEVGGKPLTVLMLRGGLY
jgi:hypothetical protein